jgi:translation elongation factor EF-1alpha
MSEEIQPIGTVTHYFGKIGVAVVSLEGNVALGDWVQFYGSSTDFVQQVESMQVNHQPIEAAGPGDEVAMLVNDKVRKGDWMYPYYPEE